MNGKATRWMWIAVALLATALLVAACAKDTPPTSTPAAAATDTPAAVPAAPTDTPEPTEGEPTKPPEEEVLFPPQMPSALRGKAIFEASCASCHGAAGDGSGLRGAADFTDLEFMRGEKPAEFFEAIRDGVEGTAMPAWGGTLSEMDIWDVLYYEWSFATSSAEIAQGKDLFAANCTACHGAAGDGSGLPGAANFTDTSGRTSLKASKII